MPQYEDVYEPPLLDATFIDKIDDLIAELQNLSAPSATNVAVSPTGLHYITEDDAQGALAELDAECFALNNSLTQLSNQFNTSVSDLNTPLNNGTTVILFNTYATTASNKPTSNSGFIITLGNATYRQQIAFELAGEIYTRYYNNGTISAWVKRG